MKKSGKTSQCSTLGLMGFLQLKLGAVQEYVVWLPDELACQPGKFNKQPSGISEPENKSHNLA